MRDPGVKRAEVAKCEKLEVNARSKPMLRSSKLTPHESILSEVEGCERGGTALG